VGGGDGGRALFPYVGYGRRNGGKKSWQGEKTKVPLKLDLALISCRLF